MVRVLIILLVAFRVTFCPVFCALGVAREDACCARHACSVDQPGDDCDSHCDAACHGHSGGGVSPCHDGRAGDPSHLPCQDQTPGEHDDTPCGGQCSCKVVPYKGEKGYEPDFADVVSLGSVIHDSRTSVAERSTAIALPVALTGRSLRLTHCSLQI